MSVEIRIPTLGELVTEATIARWLKKAGDQVAADEPLVELETDKVSLEIPAPTAGTLAEVLVEEGTDVEVGTVIGRIEEGEGPAASEPKSAAKAPPAPAPAGKTPAPEPQKGDGAAQAGPAARKIAAEQGIDLGSVPATGPKGNVTKADVLAAGTAKPAPAPRPSAEAPAPRALGSRGAGPHDPPQEAHRRAPQGGAEHSRHAHHLQRGGHGCGDGAARAATRTASPRSTA